MATGSFIGVTPGAGAKLATGPTYTEGANIVQDEKVILGENYLASYTLEGAMSTATASSHLMQIMAGSSLKVRIRRIEIAQSTATSTALLWTVTLVRLSSAGTGGTAVPTMPLDPSDAASGATAQTLPTVKGTEAGANVILIATPYMIQTVGASTPFVNPIIVFDFDRPRSKPLIIPAGTANGLCIKASAAAAAAGVAINVWIDETSY